MTVPEASVTGLPSPEMGRPPLRKAGVTRRLAPDYFHLDQVPKIRGSGEWMVGKPVDQGS